jgi:hypothetical protein
VAINLLDFVFFPCGRIFALATVLSSVLIYNLPETVSFSVSRMHIQLIIWCVSILLLLVGDRFVKLIYQNFHLLLNLLKNSTEGLLAGLHAISGWTFPFNMSLLLEHFFNCFSSSDLRKQGSR